MNDEQHQKVGAIDSGCKDTTKTETTCINETKKKKDKQIPTLNTSGLRSLIVKDGYIKMVAPKALEKIVWYVNCLLLNPIVQETKKMLLSMIELLDRKDNNKSYRIVKLNKVQEILQKYVGFDISNVIDTTSDPIKLKNHRNNEDFLFHQLTFRKVINFLTAQNEKKGSIQWSGKCLDLFQHVIEHDIRLLLHSCGETMSANSCSNNTPNKKRLKLTPKEVRMVFEARYTGR